VFSACYPKAGTRVRGCLRAFEFSVLRGTLPESGGSGTEAGALNVDALEVKQETEYAVT
jgi:hypothetical protein